MRMIPDKDQWWEVAPCLGTKDTLKWVWDDTPPAAASAMCLSICGSCPFTAECAQDLVNSGDRYPNQVRAGLRLWTDDKDQLPDVVQWYKYEPPKRKPGRPRGPLSRLATKPMGDVNFNPHTRGEWNQ